MTGGAAAPAAAEEEKKEEKKEEEKVRPTHGRAHSIAYIVLQEESDDDMGFGLFD